MNYELIDDETLDGLPEDDFLAFVQFERTCRTSLMKAIEREENSNIVSSLQTDYMHVITAGAQHYNVPGIKDFKLPSSSSYPWEVFEDFSRQVLFFTTHYRLTAKAQRSRHTVELIGSHKDRIRTLIAHLKGTIDKAEMPDWRKDRLRKHIADFEGALDARRLNLAAAMVFLGALGAGLHGVGEGADGLGKLVHEITISIGQSKEIEDTTRPTLRTPEVKPPVYLIASTDPAPSSQTRGADLDDEIPF